MAAPGTLLQVGLRGLGAVLARHFAAEGFRVVCAARTQADVEALAAEVGGLGVVADLRDAGSLQRLVERAGPITLCVAAQTSAAPFAVQPVLLADADALRIRFEGYPLATLRLLQAVVPGMIARGAGTFVQIGTTLAARPRPGFGAMHAAQHASRALLAAAAEESKDAGVHIAYLAAEGQLATPASAAWIARHGASRAIAPAAVAAAIARLHAEPRGSWTHEVALRPG